MSGVPIYPSGDRTAHRTLATGGAGFVGSHLVEHLLVERVSLEEV